MKFSEYLDNEKKSGILTEEVQSSSSLVKAMHDVLADSYGMYFQAHSYHWNVEGLMFSVFHDFFAKIYGEVYGSIDTTAEQIRAIDEYAPLSLSQIVSTMSIQQDTSVPAPKQMVRNLLASNDKVIECLNNAFKLAEAVGNQGLINYLADRLDIHAKHGWMLRSTLKTIGEN